MDGRIGIIRKDGQFLEVSERLLHRVELLSFFLKAVQLFKGVLCLRWVVPEGGLGSELF